MQQFDLEDRVVAERVASIIGEQSAAQAALNELDARAAAGESVALYRCGDTWLVGPAPDSNG